MRRINALNLARSLEDDQSQETEDQRRTREAEEAARGDGGQGDEQRRREEGGEGEPVADDDASPEDSNRSVESELTEVGDMEAEAEERQTEVERAVGIATALEDLAEDLANTIDTGDVHPAMITTTDQFATHLLDQAGLEPLPELSAESFKSPEGRVSGARVSLESIRDKAKRIWAAIIEGLAKLADFIEKVYLKILDSSIFLARRAEKLKARADEMAKAGAAKTAQFVNTNRIYEALEIKGRAPTSSDLAYVLKTLQEVQSEQAKQMQQVSKLVDVFRQPNLDGIEGVTLGFKITDMHETNMDRFMRMTIDRPVAYFRTQEPMCGSTYVYVYRPEEPITKAEGLRRCNAGLTHDPKPGRVEENFPTLDLGEATAMCDEVLKLAESIRLMRRLGNESRAIKRKLANELKALANRSMADEQMKQAVEFAQALSVSLRSILDQPAIAMQSYVLETSRAALGYVSRSLNAHGAKAAE